MQAPLGVTRFGRWLDDMLERAGSRIACRGAPHDLGHRRRDLRGPGVAAGGPGGPGPRRWSLSSSFRWRCCRLSWTAARELFAAQLPDVLKLTASSLRAGFSLVQGLDSVTRQVREPSKGELQRVLAEARLGRPLDEALEDAAARIHNRDFTESVVAVRIQQESGGNLAGLFDTLAETMVQRLQMRRRGADAHGRRPAQRLHPRHHAPGARDLHLRRRPALQMVLFHSFGRQDHAGRWPGA